MKKFRKISALMLALALICALSVSVFAATQTVTENYYGNELSMTRKVNQYEVSGTIVVDDDGGKLRQVTIETWYIAEDENEHTTTVKWNGVVSERTDLRPGVTASKTWTATERSNYNIVSLSYTYTTFKAEVNAFGTTLTYNSGPCYLAYLLQD